MWEASSARVRIRVARLSTAWTSLSSLTPSMSARSRSATTMATGSPRATRSRRSEGLPRRRRRPGRGRRRRTALISPHARPRGRARGIHYENERRRATVLRGVPAQSTTGGMSMMGRRRLGLKNIADVMAGRSRPSPPIIACGPKRSTARLQTDATDGDADRRHSGQAANTRLSISRAAMHWRIRLDAANMYLPPPLLPRFDDPDLGRLTFPIEAWPLPVRQRERPHLPHAAGAHGKAFRMVALPLTDERGCLICFPRHGMRKRESIEHRLRRLPRRHRDRRRTVRPGHRLPPRATERPVRRPGPCSRAGDSWRSRWGLLLISPAQYDGLPGMAFPAPADTYPRKDQVAGLPPSYATTSKCPCRSTAQSPGSNTSATGSQPTPIRARSKHGGRRRHRAFPKTPRFPSPSPMDSTRTLFSSTAPTTATQVQLPAAPSSWSARATAGCRTPTSSPTSTRYTWRSARRCWNCRSAYSVRTFSGGSPSSA